jgi:hypothetical protein
MLSFIGNDILDEGATSICNALMENTSIAVLVLSSFVF